MKRHVRQWEYACSHTNYRQREDYTIEDACDRLKKKWLYDPTPWCIHSHGQQWQGELWGFNTERMEFTIAIPDPEGERMLYITASYEEFFRPEEADILRKESEEKRFIAMRLDEQREVLLNEIVSAIEKLQF